MQISVRSDCRQPLPELAVLVSGDNGQGGDIEEPVGVAGRESYAKLSLRDCVETVDERRRVR